LRQTTRDFRSFHIEQARGFKAQLVTATNAETGKPLSASTVHSTLAALKAFFVRLADQQDYASRIKYADAEYLTRRITCEDRYRPPVQELLNIRAGSLDDLLRCRKRRTLTGATALIVFAILSGARDKAIISFRLKHIDLERSLVEQDSREVRTKRAKTFTTCFFPVGEDIRKIVVDWVEFLRKTKGLGPTTWCFRKLGSRHAPEKGNQRPRPRPNRVYGMARPSFRRRRLAGV
jgi:integrase